MDTDQMSNLPQTVNPQIIDAVKRTNAIIDDAQKVGQGIVYQQVTQSLGLAVQDTTTHLNQMLVLNAAVSAKVMEMLVASEGKIPEPQNLLKIQGYAREIVTDSTEFLKNVGEAAGSVMAEFGSSA
ncbi:hypothetical protein KFU94_66380 [Chloroflexi bacterium TSY]|nr:hypothetical protein [Chloroflexi bacterium TSY]